MITALPLEQAWFDVVVSVTVVPDLLYVHVAESVIYMPFPLRVWPRFATSSVQP
jgi:hypothetical protein